ncbi:MAG: response regulator transcription factor [Actinomycetia bacterium]|nr:response regulator transcription factor [Actinomycetes bacterium]
MAEYDCLIIDDEVELSQSTCEYFNLFDVSAAWVANAADALAFLKDHTVSLILLDINLEHSSGFDLCRQIRETTDIPILFISARTSDDDKLLALSIGGDDYIQKPYALSVLLAKVKAVLKRYKKDDDAQSLLDFGRLRIDVARRTVTLDDHVIDLKAMEYKLLLYLAQNEKRIVTKEELFRKVWGEVITGDNTLNVHIRHLREKIEKDPQDPLFIKTVWGTGYVFSGDEK